VLVFGRVRVIIITEHVLCVAFTIEDDSGTQEGSAQPREYN
jgi:hypothetical protein